VGVRGPGYSAGMLRLLVGMMVTLVATSSAAAPVTTKVAGVDVDWTRGVAIAHAVAPADRRAPSPAVARSGARRAAEDRGRGMLAATARALPWAAGGTVGDAVDERGDAGKAALERVVARAAVTAADYLTDGSVRVTMALPIEAVRQAIDGAREVAAGAAVDGDAVTAVVVDARGVKVPAAVGLAIGDERGAVVVAHARPSAAVLGSRVLAVKATAVKAGRIAVAGQGDAVAAAVKAGALVVVLVKP
jgi:hypothetical protein